MGTEKTAIQSSVEDVVKEGVCYYLRKTVNGTDMVVVLKWGLQFWWILALLTMANLKGELIRLLSNILWRML